MTQTASPGRTCPTVYHDGPAVFRRPPELQAETLHAAGGLYGNLPALRAIEALDAQDAATLVFNGDIHWFDAEPGWFAHVQAGLQRHVASRGNVETEIAAPESLAGCGCTYPPDVDDGVVERSNRIDQRLRAVLDQPGVDVFASSHTCLPVLHGQRYELPSGPLHVHWLRVDFDTQAWEDRFLATWPEGSDAHRSYWTRMRQGPAFTMARLLAGGRP